MWLKNGLQIFLGSVLVDGTVNNRSTMRGFAGSIGHRHLCSFVEDEESTGLISVTLVSCF